MAFKKKKKRIRPVIEEVVENKPATQESVSTPDEKQENTVDVEETSPVETAEAPVESATQEVVVEELSAENMSGSPASPTSTKRANVKMILVITVVSALVAAFVSGGVYVYLNGVSELDKAPAQGEKIESEPTVSPIITPSPTPQAEDVDTSTFSVSVLNGSGAIGAAGKGQDVLEKAGFSVEHTGNAANYNFKNTVIQVKSAISASVVAKLKTALSGTYKIEVGEALPSSSKYDIVVTVGAN